MQHATPWERFKFMLALIIAGEAVFALPFHVYRFLPAYLRDGLELTNTEMGVAQGAYGVVAMVSYLVGGPLADRFSARSLLALSLVATGCGGLYLATMPGYVGAILLWGFWGASTILLYWAALIRATREWGTSEEQGRAYGILDGGRGLLAALIATLVVMLLGVLLPEDPEAATAAQKVHALRMAVFAYTGVTFLAAAVVWFFVPKDSGARSVDHTFDPSETIWHHVARVLRMPAVWLQAVIIICAYVGYKGFDNYALYAEEAGGLNALEAGRIATWGAWVRPVACVGAGFLGDRISSSRVIFWSFLVLLGSHLIFAVSDTAPGIGWILLTNVIFASVCIYALRAVYFALFEEASLPLAVTGTAVGLVSVLGYTPDVFVSVVRGILLDRNPGIEGHQRFFWFMAAFAAVGLVATVVFRRLCTRAKGDAAGT